MNEVTKINLGRMVYTIAADAQHELRVYLDEINRQVKDSEVLEEIELRMAELLTEKGVTTDKVILKKDVDYLKKQLGSPQDFKDEEDQDEAVNENQLNQSKRLFRDTDNAILAGVAGGLAKYTGLDPLLIRLLFVLLVLITFGWGILLYVLLWILVPAAKTASERLQMEGKPVTVEGLKSVAQSSSTKSSSNKNTSLAGPINAFFRICVKIVGLLLVVAGLSLIFGIIGSLIYFFTKSDIWAQYNIFPIGSTEHILLYIGSAVAALGSVFIILFGVAILRKRWPIRGWITGTLVGLLVLGVIVCSALGASVYPKVRQAYQTNLHTTTRSFSEFNNINVTNPGNGDVNFAYASTYYVTLNYFGNPDLSKVVTSVNNKTLTLDESNFNWSRRCQGWCIPPTYNLSITVHSPNSNQLQNQYDSQLNMFPSPYFMKPYHHGPWQ